MKAFSIFALFFILINGCSSTEDAHSKTKTEDIIVKNGNSVLWKIEKENHKTAYLFGTMHMIEQQYYDFTPHLTNIIENSDEVIMEIGGQPNPIAAFNLMRLKNGSIQDFFTDEQLSELVEFMDTEIGVSPQQFHSTYTKMKPFLILQTITQAFFSKDSESYDLNIMQMCGEKEIPLIGFETMEEQLGFFDQIPNEAITEMIMTSVKDFEKEKKSTAKLMKLYAKEQVDNLIPLMKDQSPEFMVFEDLFLSNRNKAWIPKIVEETKTKKCFIAVGAAHLFDELGVIQLLKNEGFIVTAIEK